MKALSFKDLAAHLVLLALTFATLYPFFWMIVTSFRPAQEVFTESYSWLPQTFTGLSHYITAFEQAPMLRFMLNGVIVCLGVLVVQLLTAIPCAYALAKFEFRGAKLLFGAVLLILTVPIQVPALPLFMALAELDLLDTYFAMMLPFFLSVFAIYLFRQTFRAFPDEIIQAARMEGMGEWEILWRVVVPSARPAIAAFAVFSITAHWNDLYWPLIVITDTSLAPPPLAMMYFADNESGANFGALMASATVLSAPLILLYLCAQRQFVAGITMTGVK